MASNGRGKTSLKQIQANQRNAQLSTGPRSKEGKEAVRMNALTHGLLASEVVLPGEDADSFRELRERLHADLDPVGAMETVLAERIAAGLWRLRRLLRVEAGVYQSELRRAAIDRQDEEDGRRLLRVAHELSGGSATESSEAAEDAGVVEWGAAFVRDANHGNAFSKLSRYETSIERTVTGSLHELQRLQAARLGGPAAVPVAADVDVSISSN